MTLCMKTKNRPCNRYGFLKVKRIREKGCAACCCAEIVSGLVIVSKALYQNNILQQEHCQNHRNYFKPNYGY